MELIWSMRVCKNRIITSSSRKAVGFRTKPKEHGYFYISNLLWYIDGKLSEERRDELSSLINEYLPKNDGEKLMRTIADSYRDEGLNKGIAIGANTKATEIARRMLKENTEVKFIASVTGLSTDEILKLKNAL